MVCQIYPTGCVHVENFFTNLVTYIGDPQSYFIEISCENYGTQLLY